MVFCFRLIARTLIIGWWEVGVADDDKICVHLSWTTVSAENHQHPPEHRYLSLIVIYAYLFIGVMYNETWLCIRAIFVAAFEQL